MLADVAHRHDSSTQSTQTNRWLMTSQDLLPLISSSCSTLTNLKGRVVAPQPLSAGSGDVVKSPVHMVPGNSPVAAEESDSSSRTNSFSDSSRSVQRNRRLTLLTKTSFRLAHPPPAIKHRQRFNIRPKVLLQLQQISDATRPVPIFDVLPSVVFAPKLARKFPSVFKGKDGLGADDLVVVNSQNYGLSGVLNGKSENVSEDESWATREIVAAICQPKKREAGLESITEICLNHGPLWRASSLPSGAYEFVSVDENGCQTVARWVSRPPISRRRSHNTPGKEDTSSAEERRFTFSIINPYSRRHPVIATLNRTSIDISNRYSIPFNISPANTTPSKPALALDGRHAHFEESTNPQPTLIETDEHLRSLIVVTGIFVAFREGYSPNFQYEKPIASTPNPSQSFSTHRPRSSSVNHGVNGGIRINAPESPRQLNGAGARATSMTMSPVSTHIIPSSPPPIRTPMPQRAHSTGTAFLQRANNRRSYTTKEANQSNTNVSSNGHSARQESFRRRTQKAICPKAHAAQENDAREQIFQKERDATDSSTVTSADNAPIPIVMAIPVVGVVRKPRKLNKLFRFIRRASGPS